MKFAIFFTGKNNKILGKGGEGTQIKVHAQKKVKPQ